MEEYDRPLRRLTAPTQYESGPCPFAEGSSLDRRRLTALLAIAGAAGRQPGEDSQADQQHQSRQPGRSTPSAAAGAMGAHLARSP